MADEAAVTWTVPTEDPGIPGCFKSQSNRESEVFAFSDGRCGVGMRVVQHFRIGAYECFLSRTLADTGGGMVVDHRAPEDGTPGAFQAMRACYEAACLAQGKPAT